MDDRRELTKIKIDISLVAETLNAVAAFTKNEFSGIGFGKWSPDFQTYHVYRVEILDIGTFVWTEIRPNDLKWVLTDPDFNDAKLWFHRHPVGNGIPGPHNWSGTDDHTARFEPLGAAFPPTSGWTCSIVLTPSGWTGRVDEYAPGRGTTYVDVVPNFVGEWIKELTVLTARAEVRYGGRGMSESGLRVAQNPDWWDLDDDQYEIPEDVVFESPEHVKETYDSEDDDGPLHMFVEQHFGGGLR